MGSRLKVNFFKSKLVGIGVSDNLLDTFTSMLNCKLTIISRLGPILEEVKLGNQSSIR